MKRKNGFTLIELLAIIIILAIIAVITVPIILGIIDNSKKGAAKDSAYGYKDAVNKWYVTKLAEDNSLKLDGAYTVSEGNLNNEEILLSGEKPSNGYLLYSNNTLTEGCLTINDYKVTFENGEVKTTEKGECEAPNIFNGKYVPPTTEDTHNGIIYFNPSNMFEKCDETNYDSTPGVKTGCMKFYIFKEYTLNNTDYVDMILDHNTTPASSWTQYQTQYHDYANCFGPREALNMLFRDTKDWKNVPDMTSDKNYSMNYSPLRGSSISYTIDYTKHLEYDNGTYTETNGATKARFITISEIATIVNKSSFDAAGSEFYLDSKNSSTAATANNPSQYAWLFENTMSCEKYGCKKQQNVSGIPYNGGYWTSTAATINDYYSEGFEENINAWAISSRGMLEKYLINSPNAGIRPVITMSKSTLGIE